MKSLYYWCTLLLLIQNIKVLMDYGAGGKSMLVRLRVVLGSEAGSRSRRESEGTRGEGEREAAFPRE